MKAQPPKLFLRFFRWYCDPELLRHIEGDLMELYEERVKEFGKRKADLKFIVDVLLLFRPGIIKSKKKYSNINHIDMYKSYLKTGWRSLTRNSGYSFINIGGLALGMTITMLIGLWIYDELTFNTYHKNYKEIAQVWFGHTDPETSEVDGGFALHLPTRNILREDYGHYFKRVVTAWWNGTYTLTLDGKNFTRQGKFIDDGAPEMFSLTMLQGTYSSLKDLHSIILSRSTAEALFGSEDPLGKSLRIDNRIDVKVTGVYEDLPRNSIFSNVQFFSPWTLWVSSNEWIQKVEDSWKSSSFPMYVQLQPNVTMEQANEAIRDFYYKYLPEDFAPKEVIDKYKPFAQLVPMDTWHLYSEFVNGVPTEGRITFVWLFGVIGAFVLFLACINFINLRTARSEKRAREVGVRKVIGSQKGQLVLQFLSESFLVVALSLVLSVVLLSLSLQWFNELADKDINLPLGNPVFWIVLMSCTIITGLIAGLYPAFYLSSFKPVSVLKGAIRIGRFSALPRKVLVVVQFTVSVTLIIGTAVVYQQVQHARNRPIGYDRQGLVRIPMNDPNYKGKEETLRNELVNTGVVSNVAFSSSPVTAVWNNVGGYNWKGRDPDKDNSFAVCRVSHDFGKTVGWEFLDGRDFLVDRVTDSAGVILNETAARYMSLDNPIGETIELDDSKKWTIVGVIKDMIMESPYEPVKQTFYFLDKDYSQSGQLTLKIDPNTSGNTAIPKIGEVIGKIVPSASFDYRFVDDEYAIKFSQEERIGKLAGVFALFAIFISCLGLFGLSSYVAERRTKEIGIRKVLGASVVNLWKMLSRDFVILVVIASIIAIPIGYYFMNSWLKNFTYRTELSWWIFVVSMAGAVTITLLTVSYQAIKTAIGNPVNSLRSE